MHDPAYVALDSTGSLLYDGRWHSRGTRVLYSAENVSLAALEILVHSSGKKIPSRVVTQIVVPDEVTIENADWIELPASRAFGDRWVREKRSAALRVPSIAVDKMEFNFIFNPTHADFALLSPDVPRPFHFDERFIHLR